MNVLNYLFLLFIEPIKLLFEGVFFYAYKFTDSVGVSILLISIVINLLVLPLYKHADNLEREQRNKKENMKPWVDRIKSSFKGDERVMILQAYYRENGYGIGSVFLESVSLILQIPFFIAAYSFLSNLKLLQGVSLGPISDLGSPDGLLVVGSVSINLLPILMTVINIVSGFIYSNKGKLKDNIKLILIAVVFLVLLYNSPAGLVYYWTLNNVFSLIKNIVYKFRKQNLNKKSIKESLALDKKSFAPVMISCAVLSILTGVMIPADVIVQNPVEMTNMYITEMHSPLLYILSSALVAIGIFLIWVPLFILLSNNKVKRFVFGILPGAAIAGTLNYYVFNKNFGFLSPKLMYDYPMEFSLRDILINSLVNVVVLAAVCFIALKLKKIIRPLMITNLVAVVLIAAMPLIATSVFLSGYNYSYSNTAEDVSIPLTRTGKNVVVIMMDKMNGSYIPYIFNERPDVAEKFNGFTYYPNTISFGKYTNTGAPALFGGYDYTPERLNERSDVLLKDKHNEALLTMPVIFYENGWNVSVGDPSYANYQWISDLSIYDDYEGINAYHMSGVFNCMDPILDNAGEDFENRLNRNLFCYGFMKTLPCVFQPLMYTEGSYCNIDFSTSSFVDYSPHKQSGLDEQHIQEHIVIDALGDITDIQSDPTNCFFVLSNQTTHDVCLLSEPGYTYSWDVDNAEYDATHEDRFTVNGVTMNMDSDYLTYATYESSMEACITLGKWFDYLRENGLYDNTRIIVVADHGSDFGQFENLLIDDIGFDAQAVNPVLLVKDFNSTEFTVSDEFMTNADVPSLAMYGVIDDPVNPFTGNPIYQDCKSGDMLIYSSENNSIYINNGTQFSDPEGYWVTVHDNIFDKNNWNAYPG